MMRITGRVEVIVNGTPLLNKAGASAEGIGISGEPNFELEAIGGDTGLHGYSETYTPAAVSVSITDRDDVSLTDLARIKGNGTVIFRAAGGGKVYTLNGATCTRNFTVTAGEGETTVRFVGPYWTEGLG